MSHNINASGEAVIPYESDDFGIVAWYEAFENNKGPTIALSYLHNATKSWTNVNPLNYEYYDRKVQGVDLNNPVDEEGNLIGYESFISTNGIATITKGDSARTQVTIGSKSEPLRTRMPVYTKNETYSTLNEIVNISSNQFLYNNLDSSYNNGPSGYWTLSSNDNSTAAAWIVIYSGNIASAGVGGNNVGVRPVITVKLK